MSKYQNVIKQSLKSIVGQSIKSVGIAADMICIEFENKLAIHSQTQVRFRTNSKILFTRDDRYFTIDHDDIDSISNYSINSDEHLDKIVSHKVISYKVNEIGDITIKLDNDVMIEVLIDYGKHNFDDQYGESEIYRIFFLDSEDPHLVILCDGKYEY